MNALGMPASAFLGLTRPQKKGEFADPTTLGQIPEPTTGDRLYALGGLLLNAAGYRNNAADDFMRREDMRAMLPVQAAQEQRKRAQEFADFTRKYDYQAAHPKPTAPYRFEANDGDVYQIGADGKPQRVFDDPTPKMNFIPDGLGGGQWAAVPSSAPSAPTAPVGKLTPIEGGASPTGLRTFPLR
jgi:hypothetical protein